jgi:hypothetical protein
MRAERRHFTAVQSWFGNVFVSASSSKPGHAMEPVWTTVALLLGLVGVTICAILRLVEFPAAAISAIADALLLIGVGKLLYHTIRMLAFHGRAGASEDSIRSVEENFHAVLFRAGFWSRGSIAWLGTLRAAGNRGVLSYCGVSYH